MKCPLPKWFRHRFVSECKPMQIGLNDDAAKEAALCLISRHYRFAAPYEKVVLDHTNVHAGDENIGSYRVTVERIYEGEKDA